MKIRKRVFKMIRSTQQTLVDNSDDAWQIEIGSMWLARFGRDWRSRYPTTWAFGLRDNAWWYTPDAPEVFTNDH